MTGLDAEITLTRTLTRGTAAGSSTLALGRTGSIPLSRVGRGCGQCTRVRIIDDEWRRPLLTIHGIIQTIEVLFLVLVLGILINFNIQTK